MREICAYEIRIVTDNIEILFSVDEDRKIED